MKPVKLGKALSHEGLTLFPLFPEATPLGPPAGLTLLADALDAGRVEVTEVDDDGIVGELVAITRGPDPILVLDGEQLIGAKQNRTTSRTLVLPRSGRTRIPVSCMEQGRWNHASPSMRHGGEHSPSGVRRHARRVEADRQPARRGSPSELLATVQGNVWGSIHETGRRSGLGSDTGALDHVYERRRESLEERAAHFPVGPGQVGLLAFLHGAPVALDLLPGHAIYAKVHDLLVRAYVFEAMDVEAGGGGTGWKVSSEAERADAEAFLAAAVEAQRRPLETVGLGAYAALVGADIFGAQLQLDGAVVHLSAFNAME